ncbi:hypothetical protein ABPG73_017296 [Tetrahymena malaccensis]
MIKQTIQQLTKVDNFTDVPATLIDFNSSNKNSVQMQIFFDILIVYCQNKICNQSFFQRVKVVYIKILIRTPVEMSESLLEFNFIMQLFNQNNFWCQNFCLLNIKNQSNFAFSCQEVLKMIDYRVKLILQTEQISGFFFVFLISCLYFQCAL